MNELTMVDCRKLKALLQDPFDDWKILQTILAPLEYEGM